MKDYAHCDASFVFYGNAACGCWYCYFALMHMWANNKSQPERDKKGRKCFSGVEVNDVCGTCNKQGSKLYGDAVSLILSPTAQFGRKS